MPITPTIDPATIATRYTAILTALAALVARAFLRNPARVGIIVPLWGRLNRNARRLTALMSRLAAGKTPRQRPSNPRLARPSTPKPPIPTEKCWIVHDLKHEAAAYRCQLAHLLSEPGVTELLSATPATRRLLNPICHMLGLPKLQAPQTNKPEPPTPPPPEPAAASPPPKPTRRPAPCEHLAHRWPWSWSYNPPKKPA